MVVRRRPPRLRLRVPPGIRCRPVVDPEPGRRRDTRRVAGRDPRSRGPVGARPAVASTGHRDRRRGRRGDAGGPARRGGHGGCRRPGGPRTGPRSADRRLVPVRGRCGRGGSGPHGDGTVVGPAVAAHRLGRRARVDDHSLPRIADVVRLRAGGAHRLAGGQRDAGAVRRPAAQADRRGHRRRTGRGRATAPADRPRERRRPGVHSLLRRRPGRREAVREGAEHRRAQRRPAVPPLPLGPAARARRRAAVLLVAPLGGARGVRGPRRSRPGHPHATPARRRGSRAWRVRARLRRGRRALVGPGARGGLHRRRAVRGLVAAGHTAPASHRASRPSPGEPVPRCRPHGVGDRLRLQRDGRLRPAAGQRRGGVRGVVRARGGRRARRGAGPGHGGPGNPHRRHVLGCGHGRSAAPRARHSAEQPGLLDRLAERLGTP